jgi:hypothetical protein
LAAGGAGASCGVAKAIIETPPAQVFDIVKAMPGKNTEVRVARTGEARRLVEFTDGRQIGGIQVSQFGGNLVQPVVSSAHPDFAASTSSTISSTS